MGHATSKQRWLTVTVLATSVVASTLWFSANQSSSASERNAALSSCQPPSTDLLAPTPAIVPIVVGVGAQTALAIVKTDAGLRYCSQGISGPVSTAELTAPVGTVMGFLDGLHGNILLLVHRGPATKTVVVDTAAGRSSIIGQGDRFEVLEVPVASWPPTAQRIGHALLTLGRIQGFSSDGRVIASQNLTWCGLSINYQPGSSC